MDVAEFVERLAARTHPEHAGAWDAVGLQVGDGAAPVRTLAVVHELTEAVTRRLEAEPVDLVVTYHPLLFRPAARLVPGRSPSGRAVRLLRAGVAVVVTHSDFDAMDGGMADAMADALGLTDVTGFAPAGDDAPSGSPAPVFAARLGTFDGDWEALVSAVDRAFEPEGIRVAALPGVVPGRVAVSPGAGTSRIAAAAAAGADVLVSGDISHHRLVEATDLGLSVIDAGHAATERPGMARLRALVVELAGDEANVRPPD